LWPRSSPSTRRQQNRLPASPGLEYALADKQKCPATQESTKNKTAGRDALKPCFLKPGPIEEYGQGKEGLKSLPESRWRKSRPDNWPVKPTQSQMHRSLPPCKVHEGSWFPPR